MSTKSQAQAHEDSKENSKFDSNEPVPERFEEGQENSHQANDSKDERSIANRLANAEKKDKEDDEPKSKQAEQIAKDPTLPAKSHGNEPSKGAKIDKEIANEEAEIIAKMDAKKGK